MRFLLETARKDLRRRLRDPVALLIWIGIPLVLGVLLSSMTGGGGTPTARLLVVDEDESLLSGLLVGAGGQGPLAETLDIEQVSLQAGRSRIDAGDASALLIIPEGFGTALLKREPTELTLITNPAQQILPGIIEEGLEILVEATFYVQELFGDELQRIEAIATTEGQGPTMEQVNALSTAIYERIDGLEGTLFPQPVLELIDEPVPEAAEAGETEPFDMARFFLPAMLFMSVLFVAQGMSDDLWQESLQGTLRRLLTSPHGTAVLLAGKLLAGMAVAGAVGVVALAVAWWQTDVTPLRLPLALLWLVFSGGVLLTYFYALQSLSTSQRGGNVLTTLVLFPALMIGGSFFPFGAMPEWMASIGRWTPNGLALVQFEAILWGDPDPASLLGAALGIGIPAALAFLLCARRLRAGPMRAA